MRLCPCRDLRAYDGIAGVVVEDDLAAIPEPVEELHPIPEGAWRPVDKCHAEFSRQFIGEIVPAVLQFSGDQRNIAAHTGHAGHLLQLVGIVRIVFDAPDFRPGSRHNDGGKPGTCFQNWPFG